MIKVCPQCNIEFVTKDKRKKYCGHACAAIVTNKSRSTTSPCPICSSKPRANSIFCSKKCIETDQINKWLDGSLDASIKNGAAKFVYRYILERCQGRCEGVDYRTGERCTENRVKSTGVTVLQLDHIDGDYKNNKVENFRMLCPTCHSLTDTYGSLNRGKGREYKLEWYYSKR